ncbi:DUF1499 domain-containing protein [Trichloromonas sp.]|uniref:DUF1499 domain-containing protein n=1 Tax=Trichloromonas sp. TaxID=3069249 RepID=UPI002A42706B|nr:DUF1499 domain-containing protein [Trichloromonas sp.]
MGKRALDGLKRLLTLGGFLGLTACASGSADGPGLREGRLRPCSPKPNCVCSEMTDPAHLVQPVAVTTENWPRIQKVARRAVENLGGRVERVADNYLWATFRSRIFHFVDDLELRFDEAEKAVHLRSAARLGYSDFGVNRKRIEALRKQLEEELRGPEHP